MYAATSVHGGFLYVSYLEPLVFAFFRMRSHFSNIVMIKSGDGVVRQPHSSNQRRNRFSDTAADVLKV